MWKPFFNFGKQWLSFGLSNKAQLNLTAKVIDVKINELTKGVMAALLLTSPLAMAESDYPAADYQPKVLYTNPDYKAEAASPAAAAKPTAKAKEVEVVEQDPNFPAANYQPKVLFSDSAYKHDKTAPQAPAVSDRSVSSSASSSKSESVVAAPAGEQGSSNSLLGLIALAAVGFFLYSKKSGSQSGSSVSSSAYVDAGGATGVEKYLDKIGANKTGVAKYLEKQDSNPATGVAKYMAKQIVKDREAAAAKATGVEKYLRDRG